MSALEQLGAALSGRYAIEREIGRGGMATVYLARDLRHHRLVALKLLDPELGAVLGVGRFLAEIRVTANLQHPNLLPLFDSGEADGLLFYVMPYVEGESLRARLEREKQLPVEEAVRIAVAVAGALDYAHRHGVIHRDLKPANVLLDQDGHPLVADFGIALAVSKAGGARITQTGLSLGTPQYMSPGQATGDRAIDGRTDVYSLGAVLYEMLAGDPPHTGSTVQAVIAKVLTDTPRSVRTLRPAVPPHAERALECALEKLPADRFATARDFAEALAGARAVAMPPRVATPPSAAHEPAPVRRRSATRARAVAPWAVAALGVAAGMWGLTRTREPTGVRSQFVLTLPDSIALLAPGPVIALSPDGTRLAISATVRGERKIFLRPLDGLELTPLSGTAGAQRIAFSPDGQFVAFTEDNRLKRVSVAGGPVTTIADSVSHFSWGDRDVIVFDRSGASGLWRVSAGGGVPELLIAPDSARGELGYVFPFVLPGSRAALFAITTGDVLATQIAAVALDDRRVTRFGLQGLNPRFVSSGHLLFSRVEDGAIFAAPFDARRLRRPGEPVPVLERVLVRRGGATDLVVSNNGTLAYLEGSQARQPVLVDRTKREHLLLPGQPARFYHHPRLSPDGKRVAVAIRQAGGRSDVWVLDIASGTLTPLTTDGRSDRPEWTSDGQRLIWLYVDGRRREIRSQPWDGSGTPDVLLGPDARAISAVPSSDGRFLVYAFNGASQDIGIVRLDSGRRMHTLVATAAAELMPTISPDGRWIAYQTNESGRAEVYVRPLAAPGGRHPVSNGGGTEPAWSPTGKQIFYRPIERVLLAATVVTEPEFQVTRRDTVVDDAYGGDFVTPNYGISRDGTELVVLKYLQGDSRLIVATGWLDDLRARMRRR